MPRVKMPFGELDPGEVFSSDQTEIFERGIPGRPWLYMRVRNTDEAIFLPTGTLHKFRSDQIVKATYITISEG